MEDECIKIRMMVRSKVVVVGEIEVRIGYRS